MRAALARARLEAVNLYCVAGTLPVGPIRRYVAAVISSGVAVYAVLLFGNDWTAIDEPVVWLLVGLVLVAELFPITVPWRAEAQTVSTSTTWAFASLLLAGGAIAATAQVVASVLEDVVDRKPWWKTTFNAAQYAIAIGAAAAVIELTGVELRGTDDIDVATIAGVLVAGLAFYVTNNVLVGGAIALAQGLPVHAYLRTDLLFQATSNLVLVSQAPLVVIAASVHTALVLLFVPMVAAVWHMARLSVEHERLAFRDQLTGLPNRLSFQRELDERLAAGHEHLVIALVDLQRFHDVNDTLGHRVGDRMLRDIARRLAGLALDGLYVARVGGDEFGVCARYDRDAGIEGLEGVIAIIAAAVESPLVIGGERIDVTAAVGASIAPDHGRDAGALLQTADVALWSAKRHRTRWQLYDPRLDQFDPRRLTLLAELRRAIERGELVPYFQPKAEVATRRIIGMEALVRWEHPTSGTLRPVEFLPLAETAGLMPELTASVLAQALDAVVEWRRAGYGLDIAVNFAPQTVQDPAVPAAIAAELAARRLPAGILTIELTETAAMEDPEQAVRVLTALHALGVRVAVDDYGTGHASLAWIRRLPIDELKIDRSFVATMVVDPSDHSIVASTVEMARRLGLRVTAEGVETDAVWERLVQCGCDNIQGYLLARPIAPDEVSAWLDAYEAARPGGVRRLGDGDADGNAGTVTRFPGPAG